MESRQLEHFVCVAEEFHFGRAAQRLHIAQPAVSQQIRRLERELGAALFDRSARRVRLTTAGQRLLPEARELLARARALPARVLDDGAGDATVIRIGTSEGLDERLEHILEAITIRAPHATVHLVATGHTDRVQALREGRLDAAFVRAVETLDHLLMRPLWRDPLVAVLPADHPLAGSAAVALADLAELPLRLARREENPPIVDYLLAACRAAGFDPVRGEHFDTIQNAVTAIGFGPASWTVLYAATTGLLRPSRVAFRPIHRPALEIATGLAMPTKPTDAQQILLDAADAAEQTSRHPPPTTS